MAADQIRLLVVEDVPQVAAHIRALLAGQSLIKIVDVLESGERAVAAVSQLKPNVVIVDSLLRGEMSGRQVAELIREHEPQVAVVMLTVPQNPIAEDPAHGVDAVLSMPFSGFDLTAIVRKTHETRSVESARAGSFTVSLFSPKGGVGRTTLAFNLAVALAARHRVCLVDGSLQFSDLRGLLRVPPIAPSILNLPTDRITESDMGEVAWRDPSGIDILLAPPRIEMAEMITVRDLEKVLSILRQLYEFVVIDTRSGLQDDVLAFLDASDLIMLLVTSDGVAIRSLSMAIGAFEAIGYPPDKLTTVLNRNDPSRTVTSVEVEQALGRPIDFSVSSDYAVVGAANNEGLPFVTASPDAAISADVRRVAEGLSARLQQRSPAMARR
ncbi:MAG: response regulator [Chloroflexota bacterium]|nr:response regulator [Chloroflexota bacterium]